MTTKGCSEIFGTKRPTLVQVHSISVVERDSIDAKFYNGRFGKKAKSVRVSRASRKIRESKCDICHTIYSSPKVLAQHMQYYGYPKYPCKECDIKLTDRRQLKFHITYAHAEKKVIENYKLKCPVCNQMAVTKRYLRSHLYHYHNEWAIKNKGKFFSRQKTIRTETSSDTNGRVNEAEHALSQMTPQGTSTMECTEVVTPSSTISTSPVSTNSSNDKNDFDNDRSFKIHENYLKSEIKTLPSDIKTGQYDEGSEYYRQSDSDVTSEIYSDEMLKALHACNECYVPLVRMSLEKTIPTDDFSSPETQISENTILTLEKTAAVENLLFEEIQIPDKPMANKNLPFEEIQIPDKPMANKNLPFEEIQIPDTTMANKNLPFEEIQIPDTTMANKNLPFEEIQIPDITMANKNLPFEEIQIPDTTMANKNLPFEEIQLPDTTMKYENLPFEEIQIRGTPMTMGDSINLKTEISNETIETENWSFLGIYEPMITSKMENQSRDMENIEASKKNDAVVASQDNCFQLEVVPTYEINMDEWTIKKESEEFMNTREKICETTNDSSFSQFELDDIEIISNPTETTDKDRNTVIASIICDKYFLSKRSMQRHFRQRHMIAHEDVVFCVCGKPMIGRTEREKHFYQHCGKLLTSKDVINPPLEIYTPCCLLEKTHVCSKCGEKFWLETCLRDHQVRCRFVATGNIEKYALTMQIHRQYRRQERNSSQYVCKQCNSGFNTSKALSQHIQKYSNAENHQCPICKTVFAGRRLLKGHMQSAHEPNRTHLYTVFCEICNQGFTKNLYKRIHIMHCHPVEGIDEDEIIDVADVSKFVTQKRKRVVTKQTPSPPLIQNALRPENKCKVCNIAFVSRKRFIDHMIYYKKDEIVYCNICGKHFEGQYMAHHHNKKFHYSNDMQKAYTHYCLTCQVGFMYKTHLNAHMSHVHHVLIKDNNSNNSNNCQGKVIQNTASTRYVCNICEIRFQSAAVLTNHQMKYSNDGEFACNRCPRKFRTPLTLRDHISINHSDEVVFGGVKCTRCNENLPTRAAWVSHVKHFHNSDGNEPSEFCFENSVMSSKEFSNVDVELIPTNDSISSGMAYINFENTTNPTDRRITTGNSLDILNPIGNQSLNASTLCTTIKGSISAEKIWTNCSTCGLACSGPSELAKHTARYSNTGHYNCTICNRRFTWQRFYEEHKAKHFRCDANNDNFCPICDEGFDSITEMNMHKAHFHPFSGKSYIRNHVIGSDVELREEPEIIDVEESCKNKSSQCKNGPVKCITCNAVFLTNRLLKVHENNFHSSVSVATTSEKNNNKSCGVGNRFYILDGIEILPEAVDIIQNNFDQCNKQLGLTNYIYRYGLSYKCEICGTSIATKELLYVHREKIHTVSSKDPIENSIEILTVNKTATKRSYGRTIAKKIATSASVSDSSMKRKIEKSSVTVEPLKKDVRSTVTRCITVEPLKKDVRPTVARSILKSQIIVDPKKQRKHYRCKNCDIIFVNTSLLRVHQANGQCLKKSIEQINCETVDDEISVIENRKVAKLTNVPVLANQNSKLERNIECLKKSSSANQLHIRNAPNVKISNNDESKASLNSNALSISASRMRLIKLPPGNYRIEKLKVRSLGNNSVKNVLNETETKRKDELETIVVPAAKRAKKIFNPATYRELCRQHNIVPTSESQKKKSSPVPCEIVLD